MGRTSSKYTPSMPQVQYICVDSRWDLVVRHVQLSQGIQWNPKERQEGKTIMSCLDNFKNDQVDASMNCLSDESDVFGVQYSQELPGHHGLL